MDPNEALKDIRKEIATYHNNGSEADVEHILDRIEALDSWLSNGGFLPEDWHR